MFRTPPPSEGNVVHVRQRNYLVNLVRPGATREESPLVRLSCLDDDAPGEILEVLWDHEVDARIIPDEPELLKGGAELDEPRMFGAYLHALRWNCVTSTDKRLLQAPFRAGIDLKAYQLEPLRKALALPRVNLFIADDVGLGKTIEGGLVMQELILRQRVDRILIIAPPAVTRQWQEEMEQRFGLPFALYNADYVAARRRERGWGVNPWTTHQRFIVSYASGAAIPRRPEDRERGPQGAQLLYGRSPVHAPQPGPHADHPDLAGVRVRGELDPGADLLLPRRQRGRGAGHRAVPSGHPAVHRHPGQRGDPGRPRRGRSRHHPPHAAGGRARPAVQQRPRVRPARPRRQRGRAVPGGGGLPCLPADRRAVPASG